MTREEERVRPVPHKSKRAGEQEVQGTDSDKSPDEHGLMEFNLKGSI